MSLTQQIKTRALALGFDLTGITPLGVPPHAAAFQSWLEAGYQGEMAYLSARSALRLNPNALTPGVRSAIMLLVNYDPGPPPTEWYDASRGRIARYAWTPDYHDVIKPRLYELDRFIRERTGRETLGKVCVDSAPFLERDFAMAAGLGFIGRNTCLITPQRGSWTFLAALLVPEELEYDEITPGDGSMESEAGAEMGFPVLSWKLQTGRGTCGACTRCLAACPTQAFAGPHTLDARRCISYLTIELRGPIPRALRPLMGNWVFGCDICQEVCPYNRNAPAVVSQQVPDPERIAPPLLDLLALDDSTFRARYRGTPLMRAKRRGLVRNACVAAGNWGDPAVIPALVSLLADVEPLVRGHAAWALGRIHGHDVRLSLVRALSTETDAWVREELKDALNVLSQDNG